MRIRLARLGIALSVMVIAMVPACSKSDSTPL